MPLQKIAITVEQSAIKEIDRLIDAGHYQNRSRVIQSALDLMIHRYRSDRLALECEKLDPDEELGCSEEGIGVDPWPRY